MMGPLIGTPSVMGKLKSPIAPCVLRDCTESNVATMATDGVTLFEGDDGTLLPIALLAITVQVTAAPLVRPGCLFLIFRWRATLVRQTWTALSMPQLAEWNITQLDRGSFKNTLALARRSSTGAPFQPI